METQYKCSQNEWHIILVMTTNGVLMVTLLTTLVCAEDDVCDATVGGLRRRWRSKRTKLI